MVVMRADDDVFRSFAGKIGGDVVDGFGFALNVDRKIRGYIQRERLRFAIAIDGVFDGLQILARLRYPLRRCLGLHLNEQNAGIGGTRGCAEFLELVG